MVSIMMSLFVCILGAIIWMCVVILIFMEAIQLGAEELNDQLPSLQITQ